MPRMRPRLGCVSSTQIKRRLIYDVMRLLVGLAPFTPVEDVMGFQKNPMAEQQNTEAIRGGETAAPPPPLLAGFSDTPRR